jgi:hypothetical protein
MTTFKILEYEIPPFLPFGWQAEVARKMNCHRNTIYLIKKQGKSHPRYGEMVENIKNTYGKPVKTEMI